jgi:hypothetical protein
MIMVAPGSRSDGLTTSVFPDCQLDSWSLSFCSPVTVARAADQSTILDYQIERSAVRGTYIAGKLKGVIAAQTPRGNRRE